MSMLMRFATSMMNNASEGMEAEHAVSYTHLTLPTKA